MRVLLAPDKFKGSIDAGEVCDALSAGILSMRPDWQVRHLPMADGGDGTVDAFLAAGWQAALVQVEGPTGQTHFAPLALRGRDAVVEIANCCGMARLPGGVRAGMTASSYGLGQAILRACELGATRVIIGLGGSASTDGGLGMLQALGARVLDANGKGVARGLRGVCQIASADFSAARGRLNGAHLIAATDITGPLTGPFGAAHLFGAQKGLNSRQIEIAEAALARFAALCGPNAAARAGTGAAGGTGFALSLLGASIVPGAQLIAELAGVPQAIAKTDIVITGEGQMDAQTLQGKLPGYIASLGRAAHKPVVGVCGRNDLTRVQSTEAGLSKIYSLGDLNPDHLATMREPFEYLLNVGRQIALEFPTGGDV